jgi:hypothetical protein
MATVPPADRTSPSLDPRYDPVFQRGYADSGADRRAQPRSVDRSAEPRPAAVRLPDSRLLATAPAPAPDPGAPISPPTVDGTPFEAPQPEIVPTPSEQPPRARLRTGPLWLVSVLLVALGVLLHFTSAATGYGTDWSVFTQDGSLRFADGRSVEQVLAAQLAVAVAPQLVVLGVATAVATLFLTILRSERGTR